MCAVDSPEFTNRLPGLQTKADKMSSIKLNRKGI